MSDQPKRRRGRPSRDPAAAGHGAGFHLGLRLDETRRAQLLALVGDANERARAAGLPDNITPSGLISHWIRERLDLETERLAKHR
jgi:hypothetical protein